MDEDLDDFTEAQLIEEVKRLRAGIREHRDSTQHALCWHHPQLWGLLPEKVRPELAVPEWPQFLRGCLRYRQSLDEQLPEAQRSSAEYDALSERFVGLTPRPPSDGSSRVGNLLTSPDALPSELIEVLVKGNEVRIERIVWRGHASAPEFWYDQREHEWVALLSGRARIEFEDGDTLELEPGDHTLIPARRRHRVAWTTPGTDSVWLAVFFSGEPSPEF